MIRRTAVECAERVDEFSLVLVLEIDLRLTFHFNGFFFSLFAR